MGKRKGKGDGNVKIGELVGFLFEKNKSFLLFLWHRLINIVIRCGEANYIYSKTEDGIL